MLDHFLDFIHPSFNSIEQATYSQLSLDFFRQLPIPGAHLIVEMYEYYHAGCPGVSLFLCA